MKFFAQTRCKLPVYLANLFLLIFNPVLFRFNVADKRKIIMRINFTFTVLITALLQISLAADAQKVTFSKGNASLEEVLQAIHKQTGYNFLYTDEMMEETEPVNARFKNASLEEALKQCFAGQPLTYTINQKTVVIRRRPQLTKIELPPVIVTGKVTDDAGPLPGVSIKLKGSSTGTTTDTEGRYTINVPDGIGTLVFSFIGFTSQEIVVAGRNTIDVKLSEESAALGEVVVTALGIEKQSKYISYSTQKVSGDELTKVPQTNFINSVSGKVSGVMIYRNGSGVGGSAKVLIRGNKSAQGNNQPLYVINGVPMTNVVQESMNQSMTSRDGGDGISNLNPDDIESINILKGASAAALYGSRAANGVIMITTKKGKSGISNVDFSSGFTVDQIAYKPELQNSYGQTAPGSQESWGAPISNAPDNISGFFKNGRTWVNSVSFSSGTEKMLTYFSYSNTTANGVLEDNKLSRHNISIRETARFLNDKLSIDANVNIISQTLHNAPFSGFQATQLYGLYGFPRGESIAAYKTYEKFDPVRNVNTQNWPFINDAMNQNPYWVANKNLFDDKRNRNMVNIVAKYDIASWLNFQLRGNMDRTNDVNTRKYYVGTQEAYGGKNGGYNIRNNTLTEYYGDAILNFAKSFGKINVNGLLGTSITDTRNNGEGAGTNLLYVPNVFTIQNMNVANGQVSSSISEAHQQLQGIFGSISLTYNDWLSLDLTGRNDWSSNLSFTPNGSYFYPSAGLSILLHQALKLPEAISFAKLRGSYAIVGNTVPIYATNPQNSLGNRGNIFFNNTAPFTDLKPEKTNSLEFGTEIHLFQDQFSLDFSYYKTNSINQFFSISVPPGTGYSRRFINGGDIQNSGIEITMGYSTLPGRAVKGSSLINFSTNKNVVKKLATDIGQFVITDDINNYYSILKVGGSYGDLYGQVLKRDENGRVLIGVDGRPVVQSGSPSFLGNSNPKFLLGFNNNFSYNNFSLGFLFDGSFGGKVMSLTEQILDGLGVSKASGDARASGGVKVNGVLTGTNTPVTSVDAEKWYRTVGGRARVTGEYMYDATTVRLRELSLGYTLPKTTLLKNGFAKNIRLSLIGRNLVYLYKKAPFDPEIVFSSGNGYSGVDVLSLPATRGFGFNLNVTF